MRKIAIITARGGSKRIPRKNIKEFCGKPILAYSIEAARTSGLFDTVMVSTDDREIAELARKYGAEVPFSAARERRGTLPPPMMCCWRYWRNMKSGECYDLGCCIYPTAPFVTAAKLKDALGRLEGSGADTLIPVVAFSYPPQRAMVVREDRLVFEYPRYLDSRSQDLEPHYHDVGQFYLFYTEAFRRNGKLMVGNILPYVVSEMEVQDIDNQTDWEIAEIKYRCMEGRTRS